MCSHGKLDPKFVQGNAKIGGGAIRLDAKVYTSKDEKAEESSKPRVLEKKVFLIADTFTLISNCHRK